MAAADGQQAMRQTHRARKQDEQERAVDLVREENERFKAEISGSEVSIARCWTANQELSDTVLELRRSNEELLVGHEEAEANAEEIKTLNEEMQATNEELVTINEELEATVEELHTANGDLQARSRELQQSSEALVAERTVREVARERLAAILVSLSDAVLVVDHSGRSCARTSPMRKCLAMRTSPFVAEDEAGRPLPSAETPQQRAARGETFTMEFIVTEADGRRCWFEASGRPIRDLVRTSGVVAIRDITERSLYRFQDEFVALASHELRTPLTPLNTYLQLLIGSSRSARNARARVYISRAQHQVQRLKRLVLDLLDVRRLQGGVSI